VNALRRHEGIASRGREPGVENEEPLLLVEAQPQAALQGDIAFDMGYQHEASPGQGWATSVSMAMSTLV
jgi:hypothetical protein